MRISLQRQEESLPKRRSTSVPGPPLLMTVDECNGSVLSVLHPQMQPVTEPNKNTQEKECTFQSYLREPKDQACLLKSYFIFLGYKFVFLVKI